MKKVISKWLVTVFTLNVFTIIAAEPPQELSDAINALQQAGSYSWKTTSEFGRFTTSSTGQFANRTALIKIPMRDQQMQVIIQGRSRLVETPEGWKTLEELQKEVTDQQGPMRFMIRMVQNLLPPHFELRRLIRSVDQLKKTDNVYEGEFTPQGAENIIAMRFRRPGAPETVATEQEPQIQVTGAKGNLKIWIKEGMVEKYSYSLEGTMKIGDREMPANRTVTVEISNVGKTTIDIPPAAKEKLPQQSQ